MRTATWFNSIGFCFSPKRSSFCLRTPSRKPWFASFWSSGGHDSFVNKPLWFPAKNSGVFCRRWQPVFQLIIVVLCSCSAPCMLSLYDFYTHYAYAFRERWPRGWPICFDSKSLRVLLMFVNMSRGRHKAMCIYIDSSRLRPVQLVCQKSHVTWNAWSVFSTVYSFLALDMLISTVFLSVFLCLLA